MRLWQFSEPFDYHFARANRVGGTWQEGEYRERRRPIVVEWKPDSDVVGDFTWPGLDTDILVADRVGVALKEARIDGFELRKVEMVENSNAERSSNKPRVKLPYSGPQLSDLWVTAWTNIDRERSTVTRIDADDGAVHFELAGAQRREKVWDQRRMELTTQIHPRLEGQGLFVPPIRGIFRVEEFPGSIFCCDTVKHLIEESGFTNVSFLEMGDVQQE